MRTIAKTKMTRTSTRKIGLVAALIRGQNVEQATITLAHTDKAAADVIGKVLAAAIANAENNQNLKRKDLTVESVLVGAGPTLKRIRPRSRGQANRILKRTSHITIILSDAPTADRKTPTAAIADAQETHNEKPVVAKTSTAKKPQTSKRTADGELRKADK